MCSAALFLLGRFIFTQQQWSNKLKTYRTIRKSPTKFIKWSRKFCDFRCFERKLRRKFSTFQNCALDLALLLHIIYYGLIWALFLNINMELAAIPLWPITSLTSAVIQVNTIPLRDDVLSHRNLTWYLSTKSLVKAISCCNEARDGWQIIVGSGKERVRKGIQGRTNGCWRTLWLSLLQLQNINTRRWAKSGSKL